MSFESVRCGWSLRCDRSIHRSGRRSPRWLGHVGDLENPGNPLASDLTKSNPPRRTLTWDLRPGVTSRIEDAPRDPEQMAEDRSIRFSLRKRSLSCAGLPMRS